MKTKKSFYRWLLTRAKDDNAIGDLARDARADINFPKKVRTYGESERYLSRMGASSDAMTTLGRAWNEYWKEYSEYVKETEKLKVLSKMGTYADL